MMHIPGVWGIFSIVPVAVLLAISFFVLVVLQQVKQGALRSFGIAVAVVLWITAALLLANGIYKTVSKQCYRGPRQMMPEQMEKMPVR